MNEMIEYHIQIMLLGGAPDPWYTIARAITPEGAGELVRVLLTHASNKDAMSLRVELVKTIQKG